MADIKNHSTLTTSLAAYWDLEEASGKRYDLTGNGIDLDDNNSVTQATGKVGNAGQFTRANSEFLRKATDTVIKTGTDLSISAWIYLDSAPSTNESYMISARGGQGAQPWGWGFRYQDVSGTKKLSLTLADSTTESSDTGFVNTTLSTSTWYHVVATFDFTGGGTEAEVEFYVDGSSIGTDDMSGTITNGLNNANYDTGVVIGRSKDLDSTHFNGRIDEVGIWEKVLTSEEVTDLYNGGSGLPYYNPADVKNDTTLTTNLVSYWEMEQSAGATATDSHGSNDLTDNGTVGTATGILGNAADLDGSADYFSITDASQTGLDLGTGACSFSFWLYGDSFGATNEDIIVKREPAGDQDGFQIYINTSSQVALFSRNAPAGDNDTSTGTISATTWEHIIITRDGSGNLTFYINGVDAGTGTNTQTLSSTADFWLGRLVSAYYGGLLDEVAIWNKELTKGEVRALYGYGTPPNYEDAVGPATLKTWDTIATANVKTINGVAIASVKTINGAA